MVLHLTVLEKQTDSPEVFMPTISDWIADTKEQTITHLETGCRFHAFPVQHEGIIVPFAAKQIAVRFIGMQDRKPPPSLEEITRPGTQGIWWILTYTPAARP